MVPPTKHSIKLASKLWKLCGEKVYQFYKREIDIIFEKLLDILHEDLFDNEVNMCTFSHGIMLRVEKLMQF